VVRVAVKTGTLLGRAHLSLSQYLCGVRGHDSVLKFQDGRVFLHCTSCGYDSPGWDSAGMKPPVPKFEGDPQRHILR